MNLVKLTVFLWLSSALRTLREAWAKDDGEPPIGERQTLPSIEVSAREMAEAREHMMARERHDTLPSAHAAWPTLAKTKHHHGVN
jgi:hypothetical protein